jgi:hypothetical protein
MNKNQLVNVDKIKNELRKEIREEMQEKMKTIVKGKMIRIEKTKRLLAMQEKDLEDIVSGKKKISEDEMLFDDE